LKKLLLSLIGLLIGCISYSQTKQFTVKYINQYIVADGVLDEPAWESAIPAKDFFQNFPTDTI
jgi:hypothetical protein